jgi:hypothetical protein
MPFVPLRFGSVIEVSPRLGTVPVASATVAGAVGAMFGGFVGLGAYYLFGKDVGEGQADYEMQKEEDNKNYDCFKKCAADGGHEKACRKMCYPGH